jgi:threonine aldolase
MLPAPPKTTFASDNASGMSPEVLEALVAANEGYSIAYGADGLTEELRSEMNTLFGQEVSTFLAWGGTGANVVALQSLIQPWQGVICTQSSHINVDECGAPERFLGSKLIDLPSLDAKLTPDLVTAQLDVLGVVHHVQPGAISVTQSTEYGTVYSVKELQTVIAAAHAGGLRVHMDGARVANAAASLGCSVADFTCAVGVDVLSFGGTKNGMAYGEAIIVFDPELATAVEYLQKQSAQLPSKMRYISAQFSALLKNDLWLLQARHANAMAQLLADGVAGISKVQITQPVQANAVFVTLPPESISKLQAWSPFYTWERENEVRWMTSFATQESDVETFLEGVHVIVDG